MDQRFPRPTASKQQQVVANMSVCFQARQFGFVDPLYLAHGSPAFKRNLLDCMELQVCVVRSFMAFDHDYTPLYDYPNCERDSRPAYGGSGSGITDCVRKSGKPRPSPTWRADYCGRSLAPRFGRIATTHVQVTLPICLKFFNISQQVLGGAIEITFTGKPDC